MASSSIPIYQPGKGRVKIADFFTIKWKLFNAEQLESIARPHRHDYFSILFLVEGRTVQFIDFKEYEVKGSAILLMHPHQVHVDVDTEQAKLLLITFKEDVLLGGAKPSFLEELFSQTVLPLTAVELNDFLKLTDLMLEEFEQPLPNEGLIFHLLGALLEKMRAFAQRRDVTRDGNNSELLRNFKSLVDKYALAEVQVSDYAQRLFISAGHLNDSIKQLTGKNAKAFINERRILEAKRLLFWTDTPIKDVAWKTGFKDPAYFTRFFKKHTGSLPVDFQRKSRSGIGF